MNLADNLKKIRKDNNLSQEQLEILGGVVFGSEAIKPSFELKTKRTARKPVGIIHLLVFLICEY